VGCQAYFNNEQSKQKLILLNAESLLKHQSLPHAVWAISKRISSRAILSIGFEENPLTRFQGPSEICSARRNICCILTKLVFPSSNKL